MAVWPSAARQSRASDRRNAGRLVENSTLLLSVTLLVVLVAVPLVMLVVGSLRSRPPGFPNSTFTVDNYRLLASGRFLNVLGNTLVVATGATVFAVVLGAALAVIIGKLPLKRPRLWDALVVIPAYMPPFIGAIAWGTLLSPNIGMINAVLTGVGLPAVDIYGFGGIIFVMGLYFAPVAYLFIRPGIASLDATLEESARVHGASLAYTMRRVILPLTVPSVTGAALTIFVLSMGQFGVPAVLGRPDHIDVVATELINLMSQFPTDPNAASVLGVALALLSVLGVFLAHRAVRRRDYVIEGSYVARSGAISAGRWRWGAQALLAGYLVVAVVLPVGAIVLGSLRPYLTTAFTGVPWTLDNYRYVFEFPLAQRAATNSLVLSVTAAAVASVLAVVLGYLMYRRGGWWARPIDYLATAPLAIPDSVIALAFIWMWLPLKIGVYGSHWILLFAYIALSLPYALRPVAAMYRQTDPSVEDAARVLGGSWATMLRRVLVPSLSSATFAGSVVVFYHMIRELPASLLLYSRGSEVVSVMMWDMYGDGRYPRMFAFATLLLAVTAAVVGIANRLTHRSAL